MEEEKIGLFAHQAFENWGSSFEEKYQMMDLVMIGDPTYAKNKIYKQEGRHCNFCNKSYPQVSFKTAAHLLSRMIGNIDLYSTFECDACNNKFSLFETDLAYFLGLSRSITSMKEGKLPPGFSGIGLQSKSIEFKGKKLVVIHKENAEGNSEEGSIKLQYQKPTYTPANIYKLFLKCALSVLPQKEMISDFKPALEYLFGGKVLIGAHINIFRFPIAVNMPLHIYIFKKKNAMDKLPIYIASFYFSNLVISLPILLHLTDLENLKGPIKIPVPPPYFLYENNIHKMTPTFSSHDLSSPKKLKFESEEITLQFNKSDLESTVRFDPRTNEQIKARFEPAGSKYFVATEEGASFTKEELVELMDLIDQKFKSKNDR